MERRAYPSEARIACSRATAPRDGGRQRAANHAARDRRFREKLARIDPARLAELKLDPDLLAVAELIRDDGLGVDVAAELLGVSASGVSNRLSRIIRKAGGVAPEPQEV